MDPGSHGHSSCEQPGFVNLAARAGPPPAGFDELVAQYVAGLRVYQRTQVDPMVQDIHVPLSALGQRGYTEN